MIIKIKIIDYNKIYNYLNNIINEYNNKLFEYKKYLSNIKTDNIIILNNISQFLLNIESIKQQIYNITQIEFIKQYLSEKLKNEIDEKIKEILQKISEIYYSQYYNSVLIKNLNLNIKTNYSEKTEYIIITFFDEWDFNTSILKEKELNNYINTLNFYDDLTNKSITLIKELINDINFNEIEKNFNNFKNIIEGVKNNINNTNNTNNTSNINKNNFLPIFLSSIILYYLYK